MCCATGTAGRSTPEAFLGVLKIGVWGRLLVEKRSALATAMLREFFDYDRRRQARRRFRLRGAGVVVLEAVEAARIRSLAAGDDSAGPTVTARRSIA